MKRQILSVIGVLLAICLVSPAIAQDKEQMHKNKDFLENYSKDFKGVSKKLLDLAGGTPSEKFAWRPAEGIRSISEVYMHVAGANYGLSSVMGAGMPDRDPRSLEKDVTSKEEVIKVLEESQLMVKKAVEMAMHMDLTEEVEAFGRKFTRYQVLLILSGHSHEHLGQSIAYARSNGIAPPWSQPAPEAAGEKEDKGE